jgi:NAD(P)-dependent dehydrogenase (short-subunit alcohol dehydrogenase family)
LNKEEKTMSQEKATRVAAPENRDGATPFLAGRVAGKVIVVTGAASGQGAAEAAALAHEGATVIGVDIRDPLEPPPAGVTAQWLDIADQNAWAKLAEQLEREHGRVDGLVNNAARSLAFAPPRGQCR